MVHLIKKIFFVAIDNLIANVNYIAFFSFGTVFRGNSFEEYSY